MTRWLAALVLVLTTVALPGAGTPAQAAGPSSGCFTSSTRTTEICFSAPRPGSPDDAVTRGLLDHIGQAQVGDSVRIAMFRWDYQPATDAVIAAQQRGVRVEIVADQDVLTKAAGRQVLEVIEAGEPDHVNVVVCTGSCLPWTGSGPAPPVQDINHHKLYLFDIAGVQSVAITSSNLESRMHAQSNAMIRSTDHALWRFHNEYFARLQAQSWQDWSEKRRSVGGAGVHAFAYPRRHDPVVRLLDAVRCDARARSVDVLWAVIQRDDIRRSLQELDRRGCRVRVVTTRDLIENWLEEPQTGPGGLVWDLPDGRVRTHKTHDKLVLVHARVGRKVRRLTITGTSNATCGGLLYNDEVMWRLEDRWTHRTMLRHFETIYRRAHHASTLQVPVQAPCS